VESSGIQLPILISINGTLERASLLYSSDSPEVSFKSSIIKAADIEGKSVEVDSEIILDSTGRSVVRKANSSVRVRLEPAIRAQRNYIIRIGGAEPLYPPSSEGWLTRISRRGKEAILLVHEITDHENLWLSIVDKTTSKIYESHEIRPYERGILERSDEADEWSVAFNSLRRQDDSERWMNDILTQSPPSWSELTRIIENVYVPKLTLEGNMKQVMEQIVPKEYDPPVREQIMTFLALVTKWEMPREDPVAYFERLRPLTILDILLSGYLQCILSGVKPPPYVQIMQESVQHRLGRPSRPLKQAHEDDPWHLAHYRIDERLPKTASTSIRYTAKLNESKEIYTELPVSEEQARKSRRSWVDRFSLMADGLRIRSFLRPSALGLVGLIDITRAHQWPHRHMKWSAGIEVNSYKHPHLQVMEMPSAAAERVMRARPNTVPIEWSANTMNATLYNEKRDEWRISPSRLIKSLDGKRSLRRLGNEFGIWRGKKMHQPQQIWAKCLDMTGNLGYLYDFEQNDYLNYRGLSREELTQTLRMLQTKSIIDVTYSPALPNLMTITIIAQGASAQICSLARGFLRHTPSAKAMLGKASSWLFTLTRLPPPIAHQMIATMPSAAEERNIALTCHRVSSFRSYTWDFYQRLLREDGSWDEDVSAMLSQIRIPYQDDFQELN